MGQFALWITEMRDCKGPQLWHTWGMHTRSSKKAKPQKEALDINQLAAKILAAVASNSAQNDKQIETLPESKNPAAVALGRLGGLRGGKARAAKLSAKRRAQIARKAAAARWDTEK